MQYPLANYCLYVSIYVISKKQLVPKLLLQVSVQELHNSTVNPPEECVLKEVRDADNNIIVDDSTFHDILPPQLKKMTSIYKVICGCECCISAKIMHLLLLSWRDRYLKYLKD